MIAEQHIEKAKAQMIQSVAHFEEELIKVRAGKAHPNMLDGVFVDYYGNSTALQMVSNINTPDAKTITIQPWEKNMLIPIAKAITAANLGFNPQNDGIIIRINIPTITEEHRRGLVKKTHDLAEKCRIVIRNFRREANDMVKKLQKEIGEDMVKDCEHKIQDLTNKYIANIDVYTTTKEKELLTV